MHFSQVVVKLKDIDIKIIYAAWVFLHPVDYMCDDVLTNWCMIGLSSFVPTTQDKFHEFDLSFLFEH